jgi:hypothetical protein
VTKARLALPAGPALGVGLALWLCAPALGALPPAGEDVMAHLVRADFALPHLLAHGRLDGWFPRFVLGQQEFLFNGPGLTWLMALVRLPTLGMLSNAGALKVLSVASVAAVCPAVWFLARSYGLSRAAAGVAAVLALAVDNPFGIGLRGTFETGLVPHQVGAVFFCLALGTLVRMLEDHRKRWLVVGGAGLALLVVTHPVSALVLAAVLALTLAVAAAGRRLGWASVRRLAATGAAGAGLAGFWLVPLVAHWDLHGIVTSWEVPSLGRRLGEILDGEILFGPGMAPLVVVGGLFVVVRARLPLAPAMALVPVAYLVLAHLSFAALGADLVTVHLANRGLGYAGLLAVLPLAVLLEAGGRRLGRAGPAVVLALAALLVLGPGGPDRNVTRPTDRPIPQMAAGAAALARLVADGSRFATQRDFPNEIAHTGVIHPEIWLARASGRPTLNGFNLEAVSTPEAAFQPDELDDLPPGEAATRLGRLGVSHVVTTTEDLAARLAASERFGVVWRRSPLTILAVTPVPEVPEPGSPVQAALPLESHVRQADAEHLDIEVHPPGPVTATVALAWSPKWHARLDGRPVPLGRTNGGLVRVRLPSGASRLVLDYRMDGWDRLGGLISLFTLLVLAGGAAFSRLDGRRRRTGYSMRAGRPT